MPSTNIVVKNILKGTRAYSQFSGKPIAFTFKSFASLIAINSIDIDDELELIEMVPNVGSRVKLETVSYYTDQNEWTIAENNLGKFTYNDEDYFVVFGYIDINGYKEEIPGTCGMDITLTVDDDDIPSGLTGVSLTGLSSVSSCNIVYNTINLNYTGGGFIMQIQTTLTNQTFVIPTRSGNYTYNAIVNWGDGNLSEVTGHNINNGHVYATPGTYDIEITGTFDTIYFHPVFNPGCEVSAPLVKKILSWGGSGFDGFTTMEASFNDCPNLTDLAEGGVKERTPILSYNLCFNRTAIEEIPSDLFSLTLDVEDFTGTFSKTPLKSLPNGIFSNNTKVITFSIVCADCTELETIGDELFYNCEDVTSYYAAFANCNKLTLKNDMFNTDNFLNKSIDWREFISRIVFSGVQGTIQDIWSSSLYGTGVPIIGTGVNTPFYGAGNTVTSISNYSDILSTWK